MASHRSAGARTVARAQLASLDTRRVSVCWSAVGLIPRRSFEDFPRGFLLSFQILTGDDWVNQMHDYVLVTESSVPC